jgi:membrane fusion protein, multidrug efflux system
MPALESREQDQHLAAEPAPLRSSNQPPAPPAETGSRAGSWARKIGLLLILAAAAGFGYWKWKGNTQEAADTANKQQQAANRAIPVSTATVVAKTMPIYLTELGTVTAYNTVTVKSRVDGQLVEIDFKEGQDVNKGDLLAKIDARAFEVTLSQAQAVLFRDEAQLADVRRNLDRDKNLVEQGVIPQQQYDTQSALAGQLEGAVRADQAQIDSAKLQITYCAITAPITGRVGLRLVDEGNMIHASDPAGLLVITQVQPIAALFSLPEDNLPAVVGRMRAGASLPVQAMSRDSGTQLAAGTLQTIDNTIDQTTGTFKLKAVFENRDRTLWPNQFVNARLLLDVKNNATVIPSVAVQTGSKGTFVYVVKPDKTVEVRAVSIGITQGDVVSVDSGLSPGEEVVTDGQDRLRDGIRVDALAEARGAVPASADTQGADTGRQRRARQGDQPAGAPAAGTQPKGLLRGAQSGQQGGREAGGQGFRPAGGGTRPTPQ